MTRPARSTTAPSKAASKGTLNGRGRATVPPMNAKIFQEKFEALVATVE
jgi:hypothetical protein